MILVDEAWPVCAPGYAAAHAETLAGPVSGWGGLTLLDLVRPNEGWASWENLFAAAGRPEESPRRIAFDSYVYVLEAAVASHGVALDWPRFADRLLEAGTLVAPRDVSVRSGRTFFGVLTESGRRNPQARRCLDALADETSGSTAGRPRSSRFALRGTVLRSKARLCPAKW